MRWGWPWYRRGFRKKVIGGNIWLNSAFLMNMEKSLRGAYACRPSPLAIKLLEKETDIPEGAERPLRDFGYRTTLCQGYALSRKKSKLIVMFVMPDQVQPSAAFPLQSLHPQALLRLPLFLKETCG